MADGAATDEAPEKVADQPTTPPPNPWADFWKNLPASELKPVSGATTAKEGAGYPAELVAYSLLDDVTSSIAVAAERANARHVLVVEDRALIDSEWSYLTLTAELDSLQKQIRDATELLQRGTDSKTAAPGGEQRRLLPAAVPPVLHLLSAAPKVVGAAADIVGMLRTNYTIASRTMSAAGTPLVAQVAKTLVDRNVKVRVDGLSTVSPSSPLLTSFRDLESNRQELTNASVGLRARVATATDKIADLKKYRDATATSLLKILTEDKPAERLCKRLDDLDATISDAMATASGETGTLAYVDSVLTAVASFVTAAMTPPAGERAPLLAALARECIHLGKDGPSHVLFVSIDSVGADVATPASQLQSTEYVRYMGGMQATYLLYSIDEGSVVASGVEGRLKQATLDLKRGTLTTDAVTELR